MARTPPEWIGKTANSMPTGKVRQRILEAAKGLCHICGGAIEGKGWHADHVPPLKDGGENRESMIRPAHEKCHRLLTAKQAVERAPVERQKMKHTGAIRPAGKLRSAGFPKRAKPERSIRTLPPRQIYTEDQP